MVSIAGSKKLKRQMAPQFWGISRKNKRFVITVRPGPHKKEFSIPTAVFLRDTIKIVNTLREAKSVIYDGKVKIDGIVRKSLHHAIGLMDVVELQNVSNIYRLVPTDRKILKPIIINESEKIKKIVRVTSKTTIKNGKMQIGFHDGRSIISDTKVNVGDSCLIQIPDLKILFGRINVPSSIVSIFPILPELTPRITSTCASFSNFKTSRTFRSGI